MCILCVCVYACVSACERGSGKRGKVWESNERHLAFLLRSRPVLLSFTSHLSPLTSHLSPLKRSQYGRQCVRGNAPHSFPPPPSAFSTRHGVYQWPGPNLLSPSPVFFSPSPSASGGQTRAGRTARAPRCPNAPSWADTSRGEARSSSAASARKRSPAAMLYYDSARAPEQAAEEEGGGWGKAEDAAAER